MSKLLIEQSTLEGIADAVRAKESSSAKIKVTDIADRIAAISGGGSSVPGYKVASGTFVLYADKICASQTSHDRYVINHNLGKTPIDVRVFMEECVSVEQGTINNARCGILQNYSRNNNSKDYKWYENVVYRTNADSGSYASTSLSNNCAYPFEEGGTDNMLMYADENNIYIGNKNSPNGYQYILRAGNVYRWIAYVKED